MFFSHIFLTHPWGTSHAVVLPQFVHTVFSPQFPTQILKQIDMGLYDFCVYELRLYDFAENRQPPQKKKSELKVNKYPCISHSAAF